MNGNDSSLYGNFHSLHIFQLDGFPISTLDVVSLQLREVGGVPGVWLPADCTDLNCHILVITKLTRK